MAETEPTRTTSSSQTSASSAATTCSAASPFYQDSRCTIYNAPCERVLPFLDPVDLVLTDPVYGIGEADGAMKRRSVLAECNEYPNDTWDSEPTPRWLIDQAVALGKHAIVWGGNHLGLSGGSCWLVWDKDNGANDFADCELAWTNLNKAVRRIKWRCQGMLQERGGDKKEKRYHPTQKPVAVMRWAIAQAPDDVVTILDPFGGSGTTAIAAVREGRRVILIEREPKYCQVALERLKAEPVGNLF